MTSIRSTALAMALLLSLIGLGQSDYGHTLNRVFKALNPEGDFQFQMNYRLFSDSLATTALSTSEIGYWRKGKVAVTRSAGLVQVSSDHELLIVNHEAKTIVLSAPMAQNEFSKFSPGSWDSLLNTAMEVSQSEKGRMGVLTFKYPWSSSISTVLLHYELNTYRPLKAIVYSRMPLEYAQGKWASAPRYELDYTGLRTSRINLPESIDKYLVKKEHKYQPVTGFKGYRFFDQTLKY